MYTRDDRANPGFFNLEDSDIWPDQESAYSAVRQIISKPGFHIGAWKLGGTTPLTQKIFDVSDLYFGPIYEREVFQYDQIVSSHLTECKVELEIALRIADGGADKWCLCAEMPSSGIRDLPRHGVTALIADRCAAGALVLGPALPIETLPIELEDAQLRRDGEVLTAGGLSGLVDTPNAILKSFEDRAQALGFQTESGQWVATGGMSPCVDVPREGRFVVSSSAQTFTFQTGMAAS